MSVNVRSVTIDPESGWLTNVECIHSPNHDARPDECQPSLIVIHGISLPPGEFGGPWIDRLFTNAIRGNEHPYFEKVRDLRVSSHVLVRREGQVTQYVPFTERAWHAGDSNYCGREECNDFSVGIELEGTDDIPYEDVQAQIEQGLKQEAIQSGMQQAIASLKESGEVELFIE